MDSYELAKRLASRPTKSYGHMSQEELAASIYVLLGDLNRLAKEDGCIAAAWALEWIEENSDVNELRRWKEEALPIIAKYDDIAEMVGGELGSSKVDNLEKFVREALTFRDAFEIVRNDLPPHADKLFEFAKVISRGIRRTDGKIV